jgi:hypothetical protein
VRRVIWGLQNAEVGNNISTEASSLVFCFPWNVAVFIFPCVLAQICNSHVHACELGNSSAKLVEERESETSVGVVVRREKIQ